MASISSRNLVDAVLRVERMTFQERDRLGDEVHARQPNLLYAVLVLQRCGATLVQIEVVLNLLLVFHEAMKTSGVTLPPIDVVHSHSITRLVLTGPRARFPRNSSG